MSTAYPDAQILGREEVYSVRALTAAESIFIKNTGEQAIGLTVEIAAANNANNVVGSINIDVASPGDITHAGGTDIPLGDRAPSRGGVPELVVETGGTQYTSSALKRGYIPSNGGAAAVPVRPRVLRPAESVQLQVADLVSIAEYSLRIVATVDRSL